MQSSLKALESVSYNLKQKFPKIRRNIEFDDNELDLVLDFNTDPDGGATWRKVTTKQVKILKQQMKLASGQAEAMSDQELSGMLLNQGS